MLRETVVLTLQGSRVCFSIRDIINEAMFPGSKGISGLIFYTDSNSFVDSNQIEQALQIPPVKNLSVALEFRRRITVAYDD